MAARVTQKEAEAFQIAPGRAAAPHPQDEGRVLVLTWTLELEHLAGATGLGRETPGP